MGRGLGAGRRIGRSAVELRLSGSRTAVVSQPNRRRNRRLIERLCELSSWCHSRRSDDDLSGIPGRRSTCAVCTYESMADTARDSHFLYDLLWAATARRFSRPSDSRYMLAAIFSSHHDEYVPRWVLKAAVWLGKGYSQQRFTYSTLNYNTIHCRCCCCCC